MWEYLHGEVTHSGLVVEILVLAFDHDVKWLESKVVEELLDFLLAFGLSEVLEFLCGHSHEGCSVLTGEVDVDGLGEVRNEGSDHVSGIVIHKCLVAALTSESSLILYDLSSAVLALASWVEDSLVVLDARNVAVEEKEVVLVCVVCFLEGFVDFNDELKASKINYKNIRNETYVKVTSLVLLLKLLLAVEAITVLTVSVLGLPRQLVESRC